MEKNLEQENIHKTRTFGSQLQQSVLDQESSMNTSKHTPIRPLTAAYKAVSNDHQVTKHTLIRPLTAAYKAVSNDHQVTKHTPIRPLTAAYKAVSNDHQVTKHTQSDH